MNSEKTPGLYIHIPFCFSKCHYCDFYSLTSISTIPDFLKALFKEIEMYHNRFDAFDTLYIGGGTPSILSPSKLEDIQTGVRKNFDLIPDPEITIETNPADLDQSLLESMRKMGINRIISGPMFDFSAGLPGRGICTACDFNIKPQERLGFKILDSI
jgi:oxygen-independent coproporphyrinogen-3 oxidase